MSGCRTIATRPSEDRTDRRGGLKCAHHDGSRAIAAATHIHGAPCHNDAVLEWRENRADRRITAGMRRESMVGHDEQIDLSIESSRMQSLQQSPKLAVCRADGRIGHHAANACTVRGMIRIAEPEKADIGVDGIDADAQQRVDGACVGRQVG